MNEFSLNIVSSQIFDLYKLKLCTLINCLISKNLDVCDCYNKPHRILFLSFRCPSVKSAYKTLLLQVINFSSDYVDGHKIVLVEYTCIQQNVIT